MPDIKYEPNSHRYKEEQAAKQERQRPSKLISGSSKIKKKNDLSKIADVFISEDASNVGDRLLTDVVAPSIVNLISDLLTVGINTIFKHASGGKSTRTNAGFVNYGSFSGTKSNRSSDSRPGSRFNYDDLTFDYRQDAEAVLRGMRDYIEMYGDVSVGDMYDMADKTAPYTSNKYGWRDLRSAEVIRGRDGYFIKLPRATPL